MECSFCGRERAEVEMLVAGPDVQICERCVAEGPAHTDTDEGVLCSFCRVKAASFVVDSGICPECLVLCRRIIAEARPATLPKARVVKGKPS